MVARRSRNSTAIRYSKEAEPAARSNGRPWLIVNFRQRKMRLHNHQPRESVWSRAPRGAKIVTLVYVCLATTVILPAWLLPDAKAHDYPVVAQVVLGFIGLPTTLAMAGRMHESAIAHLLEHGWRLALSITWLYVTVVNGSCVFIASWAAVRVFSKKKVPNQPSQPTSGLAPGPG